MSDGSAAEFRQARGLAEGFAPWMGQTLELSPLGGGITNRNFVVTVAGGCYVLRLPGARTELLGINRQHEARAALRAAALGIGPPVLGELPGVGTLVTELVPGQEPSAEQFRQRLPQVARLLRRFHGSGMLASNFPIHRVVEWHARDAQANGVSPPPRYQQLLRQSHRIEQAFASFALPPVPCHNDLLPANLLFDGDRIWLLDYEYAGMNDAFFDLANLSVNAGLDWDAEQELLRQYFGRTSRASNARLQLMKIMSEFREGMWGVLQQAISQLDTDFAAYAGQRLAHCESMLALPDFELWLEQAQDSSGLTA